MAETCKPHGGIPPRLLLLLPLLLNAASYSAASKSAAPKAHDDVCQSIECVALAAEMASRMNASADPCRDFYNFACGNFPSVVKYNPVKAASVPIELFPGDFLFEDTIGLMAERLERNIYELLVLDRVVTSQDAGMSALYNFTRQFYRTCRPWVQKFSDGDGVRAGELSRQFLRGVFGHLNRTMRELARGARPLSIEALLAALVKAGGVGILSIDLPFGFAETVISKDDYNLTETARALVRLNTRHFSNGIPYVHRVVSFLESAKLGIPQLGQLSFNESQVFTDTYSDLNSALLTPWRLESCSTRAEVTTFTVAQLDALAACARPSDPFSWTQFFEELHQTPVDPLAKVEVEDAKALTKFVSFFKSRRNSAVSPVGTPVKKPASPGGVQGAKSAKAAPLGDGSVSQSTSDETFLIVDWLLSFAVFLPKNLQGNLVREKTQATVMPKGDSVSICMMWTKTLLQPVVERMYQRAYHREDFRDVKRLIQLVKDASIQSVWQQSWITPSAKTAIVKKIQSMKQSIGLDDITASQLKSFYNATLTEFRDLGLPDRHFGSLMSLALCAYARKNLDVMTGGSPVSMFMDLSPLVVNAYNWVSKNEIIFPMAILATPVYHPIYPDYINLGSLGYIIGHEIGHSFDNMGHTINQKGASGHFWDNRTEERYLERMECVRSRYGKYTLYPGGPAHDSNGTLGNDISDIIGIKAATEALKMLKKGVGGRRTVMPRMPNLQTRFSPEQMLFLQAAQGWCMKSEPDVLRWSFGDTPTHSPHHLRIRGIAENSQEFAEAFNCRRDAPMNPQKKCTFW